MSGDQNDSDPDAFESHRRDVLKASAGISLAGLAGQASAAEDVDSRTPPENVTATTVDPHQGGGMGTLGAASNGREVLVVKDCNAWSTPANEIVLSDLGVPYQVINSSGFGDESLEGYSEIVLVSTQPGSYYSRLDDHREKLAAFVENGGVLRAHVATGGWPCTTYGTPAFLPGGVDTALNYHDNLEISNDSHPIVDGIGNLDGWNSSTHGYLTNLPDSTDVIVGFGGNPEGRPTFVEYQYGSGTVLATTQTIEWPFQSYRGTEKLLRNALQYIPQGDSGTGDLDQLLSAKQAKIDQIQNLAAVTMGDEAATTVDQRAQALLDDIEADLGSVDDETREQYREALERMVAAEDVTRIGTSTVVGDESPTRTNLENIYSLTTGLAIELISMVGGGIVRRVANSIVRSVVRRFDDMLDSFMGRGVIPDDALRAISDRLNQLSSRHFYTYRGFANENPQQAERIASTAAGGIGKETKKAAEGLISELDGERSLLDVIEELYFEGYYFQPNVDWPRVNIPSPDQIEVPDVHIDWDVPDELLPWYLEDAIPDEVQLDIGTPDLDLPDLSILDDFLEVLELVENVRSGGGINTTIDERMDDLAATLQDATDSLAIQDDEAREAVRDVTTDAIAGLGDFTQRLIHNIEQIEDLFESSQDLATRLMLFAIVGATVAIVTGIGTLGLLGIAGTLATVVMVLGAVNLILDGFQIVVGQGYLKFLDDVHLLGTHVLAETDLGGVDL